MELLGFLEQLEQRLLRLILKWWLLRKGNLCQRFVFNYIFLENLMIKKKKKNAIWFIIHIYIYILMLLSVGENIWRW